MAFQEADAILSWIDENVISTQGTEFEFGGLDQNFVVRVDPKDRPKIISAYGIKITLKGLNLLLPSLEFVKNFSFF